MSAEVGAGEIFCLKVVPGTISPVGRSARTMERLSTAMMKVEGERMAFVVRGLRVDALVEME